MSRLWYQYLDYGQFIQIMDIITVIKGVSMTQNQMDIIIEVLGKYKLTPLIASALRFVLRNPFESFIVVDEKAQIEFMDRGSEKFFGLTQGEAKGIDIRHFISESCLPAAVESGKPMIGKILEVKGKKRIGSAFPIIKENKIIGAVGRLIFHSLEEVERVTNEINKLKREIEYFKEKEQSEYSSQYTFENILGNSSSLKDMIDFAKKISQIHTDVLVIGESGTGKELFAHSIHSFAHRKQPFVKVNCPAIPFDLAESELFGYDKGAFSGALSSGKPGKFELANNGTIFLDEIASLPLSVQAKLLRVLQEREIERLGGTKTRKIRFRLIAATNVDLRTLVKEGKFREDLYYRVSKAVIHIPPLRERREDIPLYISHFMGKINQSFGISVKSVSPEAMEILINYPWPGNIRELINVLEQAMLKAWNIDTILQEHLPLKMSSFPLTIERGKKEDDDIYKGSEDFKKEIKKREKQLIIAAIKAAKGNKKRAATLLSMPRSTFYEKIKRYDIYED